MPSLLLANPTLSLEVLHLQHYTILDSEPLHDLKGHLFNLFTELPYILKDVQESCQKIIKSKCADLRLTAVHLYQLFLQHYKYDHQLLLIQTAVQISEILYLPAHKQSPKRVLQLYNCTWFHHTLCSLMFPTLKQKQEGRVSQVASHLPNYPGTRLSKSSYKMRQQKQRHAGRH